MPIRNSRVEMLRLDLASLDDCRSKPLRHKNLNESDIHPSHSNQPKRLRIQEPGQAGVDPKAQELASPISGATEQVLNTGAKIDTDGFMRGSSRQRKCSVRHYSTILLERGFEASQHIRSWSLGRPRPRNAAP